MRHDEALELLLGTKPSRLSQIPDGGGIYALYDHAGQPAYIGMTAGSLRRRIANNHVSGDMNSHKFSTVYNAGRMFHARRDSRSCPVDGPHAKALRRAFIRRWCSAVALPLPEMSAGDLRRLEADILRIAPSQATRWNHAKAIRGIEPREELDELLKDICWPQVHLAAVERQGRRWLGSLPSV